MYIFEREQGQWSQQVYVKASNTDAGDRFGSSMALDGNTLVVSAVFEDSAAMGVHGDQADNNAPDAGAVYVFEREQGQWSQQTYLKASNTDAEDLFGSSMALDNTTLVIGARREASMSTGVNGDQTDNSAENAGAVYVFGRTPPGASIPWSQQAYLKASNTDGGDEFGRSVALDGATLVVGASKESSLTTGVNGDQSDNNAPDAGAAYMFEREQGQWSQQTYLKASNTDAGDEFGYSMALDGATLVVGAPVEASAASGINGDQLSNAAVGSGAVYSFVVSSTIYIPMLRR